MNHHKRLLVVVFLGLMVNACTSPRTIMPSDTFQDVTAQTPVTVRMIRYDDPKIRAWRWLGTVPQRWDLVVFKQASDSSELFVARVIGLPGEKIEIRAGKILVNGTEIGLPAQLTETGYTASLNKAGNLTEEIKDDHYFLLSDTNDQQHDSRKLGGVLVWHIIGRLVEGS